MSDNKELKDEELKKVNGGISVEHISTLDQKLQSFYRQGMLTQNEYLEIHEIIWHQDDYAIDSWLRKRVTGATGPWTDLYLEFYNYWQSDK